MNSELCLLKEKVISVKDRPKKKYCNYRSGFKGERKKVDPIFETVFKNLRGGNYIVTTTILTLIYPECILNVARFSAGASTFGARGKLSHTHTDTDTHTYTHSLTHIHYLSHTHTHTLSHTHIYSHCLCVTHTHTHIQCHLC